MGKGIFMGLLSNISFLLMLAVILTIFHDKLKNMRFLNNLLLGFSVGIAGMLVMSVAVEIESGTIFDARSILISVAGMFFGLIPTIIAGLTMIAYRIWIGGPGAYAGTLVILTTASIGVLWHYYRLPKILENKPDNLLEFYWFGLIVHIDMLLCMFAFPKDQIFSVLNSMMLPVLLLYPIGTYLLCRLLLNQFVRIDLLCKLKESKDRLNNIIEGTNVGTWEWNIQTGEQIISERWAGMLGYTRDELSPFNMDIFSKLTHPEDLERTQADSIHFFQQQRDGADIEFRMKHKDGRWIWINSRGRVNSWTNDHQPLVTSGIHIDISERKKNEQDLMDMKERYDQLSEQSRVFVWEVDDQGLFTFVDHISEIVLGYQQEELINKKYYYDIMPPEDKEAAKQYTATVFANKAPFVNRENRLQTKDGQIFWVSSNGMPMFHHDGTLMGYRGNDIDITARKKVEAERAKEIGLIIALLDSIPELVFYKDVDGIYLGCNLPFSEFVGRPKDEIIGKTDYDLFDKETADFFRFHDKEMLKRKTARHNEEWINYHDGKRILVDMLKTPYWDANGNLIGLLGISHDITEIKRREEEILHMGYHDQLTGLYNRRFYEEELIRLNVPRNFPLTIVMADINGLKLINDSFGHGAGDELLKIVAVSLQKGCRADDISARYGGDEFVIILPKTSVSEAERIINRIKKTLHKEVIHGINISVSFGFDTKSNENENIHDIIKKSEDDMYRHKLYESSSMRSKTIDLIINTLYEKNHREMMHSKRVSRICGTIAAEMEMDLNMISQIKIAGLVHDIGKIGIDERILNSSQKLNDAEWKEMQKHSEIGYRILSSVNEFSEIANYVLEHQEKWDGTGYPRGLKGEEISVQARIIAVADAFDAMTSYRTYGKEKTEDEAINEIRRCSGTQFDPVIAEVFIQSIQKEIMAG